MRFDLADLRLFQHVAESASITRGAALSHLALASASERIRGMEELLGAPLLERGRRGVTLTPAGESLLHHARILNRQSLQMRGDLARFAYGLKGQVRVLANSAASSEYLPDLLTPFLAANPDIDIDIEERPSYEIVRRLAEGSGDFGIAADIVDFYGLEHRPFAVDRLVAVLPRAHALAGARAVRFLDLVNEDFIGLSRSNALQSHLSEHALQAGKPLRLRIRLATMAAVCAMVESRIGIAILPERAARRFGASAQLAIVPLEEAWAVRRLHICARSFGGLAAPAERLAEHLSAEAAASALAEDILPEGNKTSA